MQIRSISYDFEYELKVAELRKALVMKGVDVVFKCHDNNVSVTQYSSEYEVTTMFDFEEEGEGHKVMLSYEYLQKALSVCDKDGIVTCKLIVKVYDKNNNLIFEKITDANGQIPEQIITDGYFNPSFHSYSPHTLIVEKEGYETYQINFCLMLFA